MSDSLVVALHGDVAAAVTELWSVLERRWALRRAHRLAHPHLTLAVIRGRGADQPPLRSSLAITAGAVAPFSVTGAGYGVFVGHAGESHVLHLAVTRTPRLSALHAAVLGDVAAAGFDVDGQYLPEHWRPHVTLSDAAVTPAAVGGAIAYLLSRGPRHWTLHIDNVTLLTAAGDVPYQFGLHGANPAGQLIAGPTEGAHQAG